MKLLSILSACILSYSNFASAAPISIQVSDVSANSVQYLSYNFGSVFVNSMNRVVYNIRNAGTVDIEREGFTIGGAYFDAYTNCPKVMAPAAECSLEIRYWPPFEGMHSARVQMLFTDKNDIVIDVFGQAFR